MVPIIETFSEQINASRSLSSRKTAQPICHPIASTQFSMLLKYFEDKTIPRPLKPTQESQTQPEEQPPKPDEKNKHNLSKTDITNKTDALLNMLNDGKEIMKQDPIWKTMSVTAGIDPILLTKIV